MRMIDADIKNKSFKQIYLLYGNEPYLIRFYKKRLRNAILPPQDNMNFSSFTEDSFDLSAVRQAANTLPFFAERRLVLLDGTKALSKKNDELADLLESLPETTTIVFTETIENDDRGGKKKTKSPVNKSVRSFNIIKKQNGIEELSMSTNPNTLFKWISRRIGAAGLNISRPAWEEFYRRTHSSMDLMSNEMDKLIAYCGGREVITLDDVTAVTTGAIETKIFDLVKAIAAKNITRSMALYRDMLIEKEPPLMILWHIVNQFHRLLRLSDMQRARVPKSEIIKTLRIFSTYYERESELARVFSQREMLALLRDAAEYERQAKSGNLDPQIAVELLIRKYAVSAE